MIQVSDGLIDLDCISSSIFHLDLLVDIQYSSFCAFLHCFRNCHSSFLYLPCNCLSFVVTLQYFFRQFPCFIFFSRFLCVFSNYFLLISTWTFSPSTCFSQIFLLSFCRELFEFMSSLQAASAYRLSIRQSSDLLNQVLFFSLKTLLSLLHFHSVDFLYYLNQLLCLYIIEKKSFLNIIWADSCFCPFLKTCLFQKLLNLFRKYEISIIDEA